MDSGVTEETSDFWLTDALKSLMAAMGGWAPSPPLTPTEG